MTIQEFENIIIIELNQVINAIIESNPLLHPIMNEGKIRFLSIEDIAAMKLDAISGRGSKKDFYALYYLIKNLIWKNYFHFILRSIRMKLRCMLYGALPILLMQNQIHRPLYLIKT